MKHNNSLFFTCSLIEFIGRRMKQKRSDTVKALGDELLTRILRYADVLHCEPIERVALIPVISPDKAISLLF